MRNAPFVACERSWRYACATRKIQIGGADFVAPDQRSFRISRFERNPAVVPRSCDADDSELTLRGERTRHDIRIFPIHVVELRRRPRCQRARSVFEKRIRPRALDFEQLAEGAGALKKKTDLQALA